MLPETSQLTCRTEGGRESVPVSRTLLNHPVSYARAESQSSARAGNRTTDFGGDGLGSLLGLIESFPHREAFGLSSSAPVGCRGYVLYWCLSIAPNANQGNRIPAALALQRNVTQERISGCTFPTDQQGPRQVSSPTA